MQNTSDAYKAILSKQHYDVRPRLTIAGDVYAGPIWDLSVNGGLFSSQTPSVGCCVSREIDLTIFPEYEIPRMAEIKVEVQLTITDILSGEVLEASEWLPKGTFYIDTRRKDTSSGALVIHGYDAMLKMEQTYMEDGEALDGWPKSMSAVATDIAAKIGVEIDDRTSLNAGYMVEAPVGYTMREIMGWIAAAHGGNWTIADDGKLRLILMANIPSDVYYLADENGNYILFGENRIIVSGGEEGNFVGAGKIVVGNAAISLETSPPFEPFSGVTVWYDDELAYRSGDDSGRQLELDCPWATQEMADTILEAVKGYVYQPYTASGALLDPAAELGDGVVVGDVYSVIASVNTEFDALCAADISAPSDEEVDHEYPYETKTNREMKRKVTLGADYFGAKITKANGLEIVKTGADGKRGSRAVLNSDKLAFYTDNGLEALRFDPNTGRYKFTGDVVVDGNINMSEGTITWGDNDPSPDVGGILDRIYGITYTKIGKAEIESPMIRGEEIQVSGSFQCLDDDGSTKGYMGTAYGQSSTGEKTYGVALARTYSSASGLGSNYVIVTDEGVRMQCGINNITVTSTGAYFNGKYIATVD